MTADDPAARIIRRIAGLVILLGLAVLLAAFAWWARAYAGGLDGQSGLAGAVRCLWSRRGLCGGVAGMARPGMTMAYSPAVFWLGVCLVLAGVAGRLAVSRRAN